LQVCGLEVLHRPAGGGELLVDGLAGALFGRGHRARSCQRVRLRSSRIRAG
jgi:hypothetical protein